MSLRPHLQFFAAFLTHPHRMGAIAPSSQALCQRMLEWIVWDKVRVVIECGPGTGVFTEHIVSRMRPGTVFVSIEIHADFAARLTKRFPSVRVYQDSVLNVKDICDREGLCEVDAIISGLPWALFPEAEQQRYLEALLTVLRPGGQFATFAYLQGLLLHAGRRFQRTLQQTFAEATATPTVWRNIPPAFVYRCRK